MVKLVQSDYSIGRFCRAHYQSFQLTSSISFDALKVIIFDKNVSYK